MAPRFQNVRYKTPYLKSGLAAVRYLVLEVMAIFIPQTVPYFT